ncbi:MAG: SDR family oxidoreductase [Polyangiaceae bacterium]|jgi:NAD(P)-dependent dehydrogenase (short-subunit alcohol dehydrogenase family)
MASSLKDKGVVVLGGASGIGLATALAAAARGAVVTVTSRSRERVAQAVQRIGGPARGEVIHLENEEETRALCKRVGALDHLVYTAGDELLLSPVARVDVAAARRAFEVRVFGALGAVKHAAAAIRPGGSIVLTHGIAGARPQAGWAVGAAVCGAMEAMTRALAVELAPLRVNAVSPGFVRTSLWNPIPEPEREVLFRETGAKLLTKRVGEAAEIAEAYCYLMENTFTTGQTLVVDGGGVLV